MNWYSLSAVSAILLAILLLPASNAQVHHHLHRRQIGSGGIYEIERPGLLTGGVTISKSKVPYVEVLRLVQSFLKIKGELGGRLWALFNDNAHIVAALRETLIYKIAALHNFTLSFIIIMRKILEFAAPLLANVSAGFAFG